MMKTRAWSFAFIAALSGMWLSAGGCPDSSGTDPNDVADAGDFTPAAGKDDSSDAPSSGYGPWNVRLRIATSTDGLSWQRAGVTVADQADVPCALAVDGRLWLFYVMWKDAASNDDLRNRTVAAYSSDLTNWTFKQLEFTGLPDGYTNNPVDPTVVAIDGGYRMYFTLGPLDQESDDKAHSFSAASTDLIHWTYEGERFVPAGQEALDPNLLWVGDHYEFFAGGVPGANHHAISADGLSFTTLDQFTAETADTEEPVILANGMLVGDAYKYYGFTSPQTDGEIVGDVRSLSYDASAGQWSLDAGVRLSLDASDDQESVFVKDPAVCVHPDGLSAGYVMIYVTAIPD